MELLVRYTISGEQVDVLFLLNLILFSQDIDNDRQYNTSQDRDGIEHSTPHFDRLKYNPV